jgi:hypothetical protein
MYEEVMRINNEGVKYLHSGNMREALLSFQNGMMLAQPLLAEQRCPNFSMAPCTLNVSSSTHLKSWSDDTQHHLEMMDRTPQHWSEKSEFHFGNQSLKRRYSWCDDPSGLRCTPSRQSLTGLNDGNYYVYDHPLVFQDVMEDGDHIYDVKSALLCIIVISFNFALACHHAGKAFGQTQRYMAAAELYYMVWSVSRECCRFSEIWDEDQFQWHAKVQYVVLNNLVHVHDELNQFFESELCMTSLRECILAHMDPVYGCLGMPTWNGNVFSSFVSPYEFEKFKLNLLYFHKPNTARAA